MFKLLTVSFRRVREIRGQSLDSLGLVDAVGLKDELIGGYDGGVYHAEDGLGIRRAVPAAYFYVSLELTGFHHETADKGKVGIGNEAQPTFSLLHGTPPFHFFYNAIPVPRLQEITLRRIKNFTFFKTVLKYF